MMSPTKLDSAHKIISAGRVIYGREEMKYAAVQTTVVRMQVNSAKYAGDRNDRETEARVGCGIDTDLC